MKKRLFATLSVAVVMGFLVTPLEADFIQCPGGACPDTVGNDLINGSDLIDTILATTGDDIVFGNGEDDSISGGFDNDILFGGLASDVLAGDLGNDILWAGPDRAGAGQGMQSGNGDDRYLVLVGETSECLIIAGEAGNDVANLIGFGPYSAQRPFGMPGFDVGWAHIVDPIAGGDIFIRIYENLENGVETIHGLLSPNLTFIPGQLPQEILDCIATLPFALDI